MAVPRTRRTSQSTQRRNTARLPWARTHAPQGAHALAHCRAAAAMRRRRRSRRMPVSPLLHPCSVQWLRPNIIFASAAFRSGRGSEHSPSLCARVGPWWLSHSPRPGRTGRAGEWKKQIRSKRSRISGSAEQSARRNWISCFSRLLSLCVLFPSLCVLSFCLLLLHLSVSVFSSVALSCSCSVHSRRCSRRAQFVPYASTWCHPLHLRHSVQQRLVAAAIPVSQSAIPLLRHLRQLHTERDGSATVQFEFPFEGESGGNPDRRSLATTVCQPLCSHRASIAVVLGLLLQQPAAASNNSFVGTGVRSLLTWSL